jgi:hypothetical protein
VKGRILANHFKIRLRTPDLLILTYIIIQSILVAIFGGVFRGQLLLIYSIFALFVGILACFPHPDKPSFLYLIKIGYPLVLMYFFYRLVGIQHRFFGFDTHDAIFNSIEKTVFGIFPTFAMQRIMEIWLNELSYVLYLTGIFIPLWLLVKLYQKGHLNLIKNFVIAFEIGCLTCLVISSMFPVSGPNIAIDNYYYLGIYGPLFSLVIPFFIDILSINSGSFPAIYFCIITISAYYLWDFGRVYIIASFFVITAVFWGGIYLRYHYFADGLVAMVIAFIAVVIAGGIYYKAYGNPPDFT